MTAVPSKSKIHQALSSDARAETLEFLYKKPHDIEEIAKKLKLQSTTVRHHIQALLEAGLVESYEERTGLAGRPKTYYKIAKSQPMVTFPARRYQDLSTNLISYLLKKFGKKTTFEMMTEFGQEMGKDTVSYLQTTNNITQWNPDPFVSIFCKYLQEMGAEPELIEKTDNKVVFRTHNCLFYELSQKLPDLMCDVIHHSFNESCYKNMGGNIRSLQTKCMGHGDECCEQVLEWMPKKQTATKRK